MIINFIVMARNKKREKTIKTREKTRNSGIFSLDEKKKRETQAFFL
jgi:hypothetical protein